MHGECDWVLGSCVYCIEKRVLTFVSVCDAVPGVRAGGGLS